MFGSLFRAGLNLFMAGWTLVTKGHEDPINWFYDSTSLLLTGQLFPVTVLPTPLLLLAKIHPVSYVQLLARKTGLGGSALPAVAPELTTLIGEPRKKAQ